MKYCPYCGADLIDGAASFCAECGKTLPASTDEKQATPDPIIYKKERPQKTVDSRSRTKKKRKRNTNSCAQAKGKRPVEDGYDGYYDDVLPSDLGRTKEGVDKELIKKIVAVAGIMLLIVGLCVLAMYLL